MSEEQSKLKKDWVVVREDWHYRKTYVPFESGKYYAVEEEAKARAEALQARTHTKDHEHKQSFSAEKYAPEKEISFG